MPNARIAQIGQVAVNQPMYEVVAEGKRYALLVNPNGRAVMITPRTLLDLGVNSLVANRFESAPDYDIIKAISLDANRSTAFDSRFPYVQLGTGYAFVSDYSPISGWKAIAPANSRSFNY
ncbi:hypothetical protein [Spirosoma linguale]|uniref:Uncharacterized protein n=1 Tax=Spirosoma linguale (strain ATCC 33905 / DSM 74 / LMG 10896 / Claus 1) TaxID=504472 RepID=D2QGY5_SPILD|nr:hypothetical protein Slin_0688 [Spirosoma linguale DSM 74]